MDYDAADYRAGALGAAETARADATRSYFAKLASEKAERVARPFRFEDLDGKPEPEKWGPCYPKTASASVEKWRAIARGRELSSEEAAAYGQAVHTWIRALNNPAARRHDIPASDLHYCYSSAKRRAQIRAACAATAGAARRAWCDGKAKSNSHGHYGLTIAQAYAAAMAEKRARLEALELAA